MANDQKATLDEEIRFIKKQEWYVATAAITLIGALYGIAHTIAPPPTNAEKAVATVLVTLVAACTGGVLISLHDHLVRKRKERDKADPNPGRRGVEIPISLIAAVATSAFVVIYTWWRTAAC
jgi:hypothetical protein